MICVKKCLHVSLKLEAFCPCMCEFSVIIYDSCLMCEENTSFSGLISGFTWVCKFPFECSQFFCFSKIRCKTCFLVNFSANGGLQIRCGIFWNGIIYSDTMIVHN